MLSIESFRGGVTRLFTAPAERVSKAWQRYLAILQENHQRRVDEIGLDVFKLYTISDETRLPYLALEVLRLTQEHPSRDLLIGEGLEDQVNNMVRQGRPGHLLIWVIDKLSNQIGHPSLILTGSLQAADDFWQTHLEQPGIPVNEVLVGIQRRIQISAALQHLNPSITKG